MGMFANLPAAGLEQWPTHAFLKAHLRRFLGGTPQPAMRLRKERISEAGLHSRAPPQMETLMKRITLSVAVTVAGLVIGPNLASALTAMTTEPTNLRAGPAFDFPVVDSIPDDARVTVHGCVRAYRWCDISWRDARGWVSGDELAYSISSGMCRL